MGSPSDEELISSIASDVMKCLERSGFFEKLDELLSPEANSAPAQTCDGTYKLGESVLFASGFERTDFADIFGVLHSKGACCDCEVLYNVAGSSRLKSKYWSDRAVGRVEPVRHKPHSKESI